MRIIGKITEIYTGVVQLDTLHIAEVRVINREGGL